MKERQKILTSEFGKERYGKRVQILASIILLSSFITQSYLYDYWNEKNEDLRATVTSQSLIDKSVVANEALYFLVESGDGDLQEEEISQIREQKIREAARKLALSQSLPISVSDLPRKEKVDRINGLIMRATAVHDYRSYLAYIQFVNENGSARYVDISQMTSALNERRAFARNVYLILYILGSVLLLVGIRYQ